MPRIMVVAGLGNHFQTCAPRLAANMARVHRLMPFRKLGVSVWLCLHGVVRYWATIFRAAATSGSEHRSSTSAGLLGSLVLALRCLHPNPKYNKCLTCIGCFNILWLWEDAGRSFSELQPTSGSEHRSSTEAPQAF